MKNTKIVINSIVIILLQLICIPSLFVGNSYLPLISELTMPFYFMANTEYCLNGLSLLGIIYIIIAIVFICSPIIGIFLCRTRRQYYWFVFLPIILSTLQTIVVTLVNISSFWSAIFFFIYPGFYIFLISIYKGLITLQCAYALLKQKQNNDTNNNLKKVPCILLSIVLAVIPLLFTGVFYKNLEYRYKAESANEFVLNGVAFYNDKSNLNPKRVIRERANHIYHNQNKKSYELDEVTILVETNKKYVYGLIYKHKNEDYVTIIKSCDKDFFDEEEILVVDDKIQELSYNSIENGSMESKEYSHGCYKLINGYLYCICNDENVLRYDCTNNEFDWLNMDFSSLQKELVIQGTDGIKHIKTKDDNYNLDMNEIRELFNQHYGSFMFFLNYKCHSNVVVVADKVYFLIKSPIHNRYWLITEIDYKWNSINIVGFIKDNPPAFHYIAD